MLVRGVRAARMTGAMPRHVKILMVLGLAVAALLLGVAFSLGDSATPKPCREPSAIEGTTPGCNAPNVPRQQPITVDLRPGYDAEIVFEPSDGPAVALPRDELVVQSGSGIYIYQPGASKTVTSWAPTTCLQVNYFKILEPEASKGSYRFCFSTV